MKKKNKEALLTKWQKELLKIVLENKINKKQWIEFPR